MALPIPILGAIVNGISGYFTKKQEIKKASVDAQNKVAQIRATGDQSIRLTDAEWEAIMAKGTQESWKDEYITIVMTLPLLQIFIGNLLSIWLPERGAAILAANKASLEQIGELMSTPYGEAMMVVIFAAVGIKATKAIFK